MKHLQGIDDIDFIRDELLLAARQAGPRLLRVRGVELEAAITGVHPEATPAAPGPAGPDDESTEQPPADEPAEAESSQPKPKRKRRSRS